MRAKIEPRQCARLFDPQYSGSGTPLPLPGLAFLPRLGPPAKAARSSFLSVVNLTFDLTFDDEQHFQSQNQNELIERSSMIPPKRQGSRSLNNLEQRAKQPERILVLHCRPAVRLQAAIKSAVRPPCMFEETIMSERQPLSSVVPLAAIERPACPQCQKRMTLARIVPALLGTVLYTFECAACNHVLRTLAAGVDAEKPKDTKDAKPKDTALPTFAPIVQA
jgi:hypothetical protein